MITLVLASSPVGLAYQLTQAAMLHLSLADTAIPQPTHTHVYAGVGIQLQHHYTLPCFTQWPGYTC